MGTPNLGGNTKPDAEVGLNRYGIGRGVGGWNIATITNDLNPDANTDFNMDALDFLKMQANNSASVLLDPPTSECRFEGGPFCFLQFDAMNDCLRRF